MLYQMMSSEVVDERRALAAFSKARLDGADKPCLSAITLHTAHVTSASEHLL